MAKKGSAVAQFGINVSAFAAGGKFMKRELSNIAAGFKNVATVAAGVAGGLGLSNLTSKLTQALGTVVDMAVEFDNIKAASGVTASLVQKMRFSAQNRVSFGTASSLLGDTGSVWDKYAGAIRDASVRWAAASERARAAWAAVIGELAPVFSKILDDFQKFDLVGTAKQFAEVIGNGAKIVYQLLTDGELYSTIAKHFKSIIGSAIQWLGDFGEAGTKVLELMWTNSISIAFNKLWTSWKDFSTRMADYLSLAFLGAVNKMKEKLDELLSGLNTFALGLGLGDAQKVQASEAERRKQRAAERYGIEAQRNSLEAQYGSKSFSQELVKIFRDLKANGKGSPEFAKLTKDISSALDKFNVATSTKKFDIENRSIGQNYAASSMAAIGGGGYVGVTSAQTMADNIRRQTSIQERMDTKLGAILEALTNKAIQTLPQSIFGSTPVAISNFPMP